MATKGKGKVLDGQIAFNFFGELKEEIVLRKMKTKKENKTKKVFRKKKINVKANNIKSNRKVRKLSKRR